MSLTTFTLNSFQLKLIQRIGEAFVTPENQVKKPVSLLAELAVEEVNLTFSSGAIWMVVTSYMELRDVTLQVTPARRNVRPLSQSLL